MEKSTYPHALLWIACQHTLKNGQNEQEGAFHSFMSSMLMSALCWEAFLNYLGQENVEYWDVLERLSPQKKLQVLSHHVQYKPDNSRRPFQTLSQIIQFRNSVAHAKPMIDAKFPNVSIGADGTPNDFDSLQDKNTNWIALCNEQNAKRFLEDVTEAAKELYKQAGYKGHPFGITDTAVWRP